MARMSDNGRAAVAYAVDVYGRVYTPTEAKRRRKSIRKRKLQRAARRRNRK